jgi:hypothetical protein
MSTFRLDQLLDYVTSTTFVVGALWLGLAGLTAGLLVLMRTRWGQYHQLRKCLILSVLAHLLFVGYATTVQIVASTPAPADEYVHVSLAEEAWRGELADQGAVTEEKPWESFVHETAVRPEPYELARVEPDVLPHSERRLRNEETVLPSDPLLERIPLYDAEQPDPDMLPADPVARTPTAGKSAEQIEAPAAQRREAVRTEVPVQPEISRMARADSAYADPVRRIQPGLHSTLLERLAPPPRLRDVATRPDPDDTLAGLADKLERASHGGPAHWSSEEQPQAGTRPDPASRSGPGPTGDRLDHLRPPALAVGGRAAVAGGSQQDPVGSGNPSAGSPLMPVREPGQGDGQLPAAYRLRVAPDRDAVAESLGATPESQEAVRLALKWMADSQDPDGNWDASKHGAGRELQVAGRNRYQAGARADTGITGLALLAFLAAGHTHQAGDYQSTVRRGLEYLIRSQASDGGLGGEATTYARMYCHAMAAFALSEACGMTRDERLREPVVQAIAYTLASQNPTTGGWRYSPGDAGDTSQLGWQIMALKSAELAGVPFPVRTRNGAIRFLNSVAHGKLGGLSAYRPGEKVSRPMTAEALACRHFLGMAHDHPAGYEGGRYIIEELPGEGPFNLYYWYYGTLAMYQLQGEYWDRWNQALQKTLIDSQRKSGPLAGSWDPESVWGGYGGRVYTTALATLCLEVYYRFLPLYLQASGDRAAN